MSLILFYPVLYIFMVTVSYATSQLIWLGILALIPIKRSKDDG